MSLSEYIQLLKQKLWIIGSIALATGLSVFLIVNQRAPTYRAEVTISIGGYIQAPNPTSLDIRASVELAQTYAVLATTNEVLEAASQQSDFPVNTDKLPKMVQAKVVPATSLVVISVTYTDPVWAAEMANTIAQQLIMQSPTNLTDIQQAQLDLADAQITELSILVDTIQDELARIDQQVTQTENQQDIKALRERQDTLISQITAASATIAQFSNTIVSLQERTNSLAIVEYATVPTSSTGFSSLVLAIFAGIGGAVGSVIIILIFEYLDNKVRQPQEAVDLLDAPAVGFLSAKNLHKPAPYLAMVADPSTSLAKSYHVLRAKLLFPSLGQPRHYVFFDHEDSIRKSVCLASLGIVSARAGLKVLLIDANFEQPYLHTLFNLPSEKGLGTLFTQEENLDEKVYAELVSSCIQSTAFANLSLLAAGPALADPSGALASAMMIECFHSIIKADAQVILLDSPSISHIPDAFVLAAGLQIPIVMCVGLGKTSYQVLMDTHRQIEQFGITLAGIAVMQP